MIDIEELNINSSDASRVIISELQSRLNNEDYSISAGSDDDYIIISDPNKFNIELYISDDANYVKSYSTIIFNQDIESSSYSDAIAEAKRVGSLANEAEEIVDEFIYICKNIDVISQDYNEVGSYD